MNSEKTTPSAPLHAVVMRQFALFAGDEHYPSGGFDDFVGSFDSVEEAEEKAIRYDWWHVFDVHARALIRHDSYTEKGLEMMWPDKSA